MEPWLQGVMFVASGIVLLSSGLLGLYLKDRFKPKQKVYQAPFTFLETPAKKARHLKEHREWDNQFNGILKPLELIVYNGQLITLEQADLLFFIEEEKRKR